MKVTLERWGAHDLSLLHRANTPEMTGFLGGPETEAALAERHSDYLALWDSGQVRMFRVDVDGVAAGYAGWWEEEHDGVPAYEVGCVVEPAWQGCGVASTALSEVVRLAAANGDRHLIVAYTDVGNIAAQALCARVGFSLAGTGAFPSDDETSGMSVNVWMIDTETWHTEERRRDGDTASAVGTG